MAFAFSFVLGQNMGQSDSMLSDRFESEKVNTKKTAKSVLCVLFVLTTFGGEKK